MRPDSPIAVQPSPLTLQHGRLTLQVDPARGGRLDRLVFNGVDLVLPPGRVPGFHGDTFWPSPQSRFEWPPPAVLDAGPYTVTEVTATELALVSGDDHEFGFRLAKRFRLGPDRLSTSFVLTNIWDVPQSVAPWQVTRAVREGVIVWGTGAPFVDADRLQKQHEDPGCWFVHRDEELDYPGLALGPVVSSVRVGAVRPTSKLFCDARGWAAHAQNGALLLRLFPDLSIDDPAPRQAELELYFDLERDYIEIENQGRYVTLEPGEGLTYRTTWHCRLLTRSTPTDRVTPALVEQITAALAGATAAPASG